MRLKSLKVLALACCALPAAAFGQLQKPSKDWVFEQRQDAMSDFVAGFAQKRSVEDNGSVILTCRKSGKNSVHLVFVPASLLVAGPRPAEFRFDSNTAFRSLVLYSNDSVVWIDLRKFLKRASGATLMRARFIDARSQNIDMTFELSGLDQAVQQVATTCKDPIGSVDGKRDHTR